MKMSIEELEKILEKHKSWLNGDAGGVRADLYGADLSGADLIGAYLRGAYLRGAYLRGADFHVADLSGADLIGAYLRGADLHGAYLRGADLSGANLSGADLSGAYLRGANLSGADLIGAYLHGADLIGADLIGAYLHGADFRGADFRDAKNLPFIPMTCPDTGEFTAWKRAGKYIVRLSIPENARRCSATGRKCRCDMAMVVGIENLDGTESGITEVASSHDHTFIYRVGEIAKVDDYDANRWNECSEGIHFFINRQEAVEY